MAVCVLDQDPTRKNLARTLYALSVARIEFRFDWLVYPSSKVSHTYGVVL